MCVSYCHLDTCLVGSYSFTICSYQIYEKWVQCWRLKIFTIYYLCMGFLAVIVLVLKREIFHQYFCKMITLKVEDLWAVVVFVWHILQEECLVVFMNVWSWKRLPCSNSQLSVNKENKEQDAASCFCPSTSPTHPPPKNLKRWHCGALWSVAGGLSGLLDVSGGTGLDSNSHWHSLPCPSGLWRYGPAMIDACFSFIDQAETHRPALGLPAFVLNWPHYLIRWPYYFLLISRVQRRAQPPQLAHGQFISNVQ